MTGAALTHASLHHAILRHLVDYGHAPSRAQLAEAFAVDGDTMAGALQALAADHGVVLHPHAPEVWVIHPFSTAPTPFAIRHDGRVWWGNCAWCSLGVAALLGGRNVTIDTTLGAEGQPVTVHVDDNRVREELVVHFPIAMAHAWDNVVFTCSTMLVFEREADVDDWSRRHALPRGDVRPIQTVYDFARQWYGRHLDQDWRKWTTGEAREHFERFGLEGPIWDLPRTDERF
jgi:hypothetical protein